jgi:hypothetical protein
MTYMPVADTGWSWHCELRLLLTFVPTKESLYTSQQNIKYLKFSKTYFSFNVSKTFDRFIELLMHVASGKTFSPNA